MGFEAAASGVEGAELDRHARADADEGREGAFVEGEGAFFLVDGLGGGQGGGVEGGGLQADFDDVEWLAWGVVSTVLEGQEIMSLWEVKLDIA